MHLSTNIVPFLFFQAMSAYYYGKTQLLETEEEIKRLSKDNTKMKREFESERALLNSSIATKEQVVSLWISKVGDLKDEVASLKASDQESKQRITCVEQNMELEATGVNIINTWKMIQEFQDGNVEDWNTREAESAYKEMFVVQANIEGKILPVLSKPLPYVGDTAYALVTE